MALITHPTRTIIAILGTQEPRPPPSGRLPAQSQPANRATLARKYKRTKRPNMPEKTPRPGR
jgi:hypothetical protein